MNKPLETMSQCSTTHTTVSHIVLVDGGLSHRCCVDRELGLCQELPDLLLDAVADGTGVDEDGDIAIGLLNQPVNAFNDRSFDGGVILGWLLVNGGVQPRGRDPLIGHICGKRDINRTSLRKTETM